MIQGAVAATAGSSPHLCSHRTLLERRRLDYGGRRAFDSSIYCSSQRLLLAASSAAHHAAIS
jgi:hypothetical protein